MVLLLGHIHLSTAIGHFTNNTNKMSLSSRTTRFQGRQQLHRMRESRAKKINRLELQEREEIMLFGHLGAKKEMHKCRRCERRLRQLN